VFPCFDVAEMPKFEEKVPKEWQSIEDQFTFFTIVNAPYID